MDTDDDDKTPVANEAAHLDPAYVIGEIHSALVALTSDATEPDSFDTAVNDPKNGASWRQSVEGETAHFKAKGVYSYEDQERVRQRLSQLKKRPIKAKWIFKRKTDKDGNLFAKSCCVAKGFTQIPGVDYVESYAPVINDVTARTVFTIGLNKGYDFQVYDVNAAFLNGDLEEEIYLELPEGFDHPPGTIVQLCKAMYGLV